MVKPFSVLPSNICKCQDSNGTVCNKVMSKQEFKQDGMCGFCADNVWEEMATNSDSDMLEEYKWYHPTVLPSNIPVIHRVRALYRCDQCGKVFTRTAKMYQQTLYSNKCIPNPADELMCPRAMVTQNECYGMGQRVTK